mmetsp:Transcript_8025/g.14608  ORF Transcript_8025/g.14608 Transcript_8025/m.14608 type:complete len:229 (-) Transcript_8025:8-694(-)
MAVGKARPWHCLAALASVPWCWPVGFMGSGPWRPWAEQVEDLAGQADCEQASAVAAWVTRVVIGHGLCPWAEGALRQGSLAVVSLPEAMEEEVAAALITHAQLLAAQNPPAGQGATTLLVAPRCSRLRDFEGYLELCGWVEDALAESGLNGQVQMATFHPNFQFEGSEEGDCANFVGRAPFPAFHLLREKEVSSALASFRCEHPFQGPEEVGEFVATRNARFLREHGR